MIDDEKYENAVIVLNNIMSEIYTKCRAEYVSRRKQFNKYYSQIISITQKYPEKKFYVVYDHTKVKNDLEMKMNKVNNLYATINGKQMMHHNDIHDITNAQIYSEKTIGNVISSDIDLNKLCFSGGFKPCDFIGYPRYYDIVIEKNMFMGDKMIFCISQFASECKNLQFVHPKLLKYGKINSHFRN